MTTGGVVGTAPASPAAGGAPGAAPGAAPGTGGVADGTGTSAGAVGFAAVVCGGAGGCCSFCQASQRNSAENEKMTNSISRCVSMRACGSGGNGRRPEPGAQGTGSYPPG